MTASRLGGILLKSLLGLVALELVARLVVAVGHIQLPESGVGGLDRRFIAEGLPPLLQPDRNLIFSMRPNVDGDYPRYGAYDQSLAKVHVHTNDRGYRTPPFSDAKAPGVIRIVCLGDSSTFGMQVEERETYPRQLAARLEEAAPGRFEVINLGVPGYSSRQGVEQVSQQVLALQPDVVFFAFGTNDRAWPRELSDEELITLNQSATGGFFWRLRQVLDHVTLYKVLRALTPLVVPTAPPATDASPRASGEGIATAITATNAMVHSVGGTLVVLNGDFFGTDAIKGIAHGVQSEHTPFIDLVGTFNAVRQQATQKFEIQHHLPPLPRLPGQMTFRVYAPHEAEVTMEMSRFGRGTEQIVMHDDGSNGDQVEHDGVFTAVISGRNGEPLHYVYLGSTPIGPVREFSKPRPSTLARQMPFDDRNAFVDQYGEVMLLADPTHPDAQGQAIIAQALAAYLLADPQIQARLHPSS
jgi:lysophospholipase L1-like esterase